MLEVLTMLAGGHLVCLSQAKKTLGVAVGKWNFVITDHTVFKQAQRGHNRGAAAGGRAEPKGKKF